ncbi:MAG: hypothetical protein ACREUA_08695 [Burkholderiales bacterium]
MQFKLTLPPETLTAQAPETRLQQTRQWLDGLPATNPGRAMRKIWEALVALNRHEVAPDVRLKLLEMHRAAVVKLLADLEPQYAAEALPLTKRNRLLAGIARQTQVELAYGYKVIIAHCLDKRSGIGGRLQFVLVVQRALRALNNILIISYQIYAPVPAGIWSEIHMLYWYAAQQGIQDDAVADGAASFSIDQCYKQVVLLALVDPYRLMDGETARILHLLVRFTDKAVLQSITIPDDVSGLFLVRLSDDAPPKALAYRQGTTDEATDVLLNTIELARALHRQLQDMEMGKLPEHPSLPDKASEIVYRGLLVRLIKYWGLSPKRHFRRSPEKGSKEICTGLISLHHALDPDPNTPIPVTRWLILNESAGGLALIKNPSAQIQLKVGEVIGLRPDKSTPFVLGVVRRAYSESGDHLEIGVQMLAPTATAVSIRAALADGMGPVNSALLLPEYPALKTPVSLLAPPGSYEPQREFTLDAGGETSTVYATDLLERTGRFDHFQFV